MSHPPSKLTNPSLSLHRILLLHHRRLPPNPHPPFQKALHPHHLAPHDPVKNQSLQSHSFEPLKQQQGCEALRSGPGSRHRKKRVKERWPSSGELADAESVEGGRGEEGMG